VASRLTRRAGEIVACEEADAALAHGIDGQRESTTGGLRPDEDYYRARGGAAAEDVNLHMEAAATPRHSLSHRCLLELYDMIRDCVGAAATAVCSRCCCRRRLRCFSRCRPPSCLALPLCARAAASPDPA